MSKSNGSTWPTVRLGTLAEFRNGINYNKDNFGKGIRVINVKDFQEHSVAKFDELDEINPDGVIREESLLKNDDIIFVRSNGNRQLIGRSMIIKDVPGPISHSAFSIKLRFTSPDVLPRFYAYLFRTQLIRQILSAHGGGTNIANLNQTILNNLEVPFPPLPTQRKITSILSTYDDLIENNTRRIAILEEMAQAIYREWFVHFRFPGHENVKLVDSPLGQIPEGWEVTTLKAVCVEKKGIQTGPFGSQLHRSDYTDEGRPVVMPKDIVQRRISVDSIARVPESIVERLPRHVLEHGDTVCARRGEIGRNAFVTDRESGWMCGTGCMKIRPKKDVITPRFLFDTLCWPDTVSVIAGKAAGAIMPNLNIGIMESIPIILPPTDVMSEYERLAMESLSLLNALSAKNRNLSTTRDLLLPKLISGKLDVEDLDLDIDTGELTEELEEATA